jgi:beta-mannanase
MNITNTAQAPFIDNFLAQVQASNTDAIMYLTLYPSEGFAAVTPAGIEEFANSIKKILDAKRKVLIRYASEMNGNWFKYGRQPLQFIQSWRQVVTAVRAKAGAENKDNYAFIWAPNSGNGYPFGNFTGDAASIQILDTNGDGVVGPEDDPYSPYYPGNEWVDWVGFSVLMINSDLSLWERMALGN